jgi:hypothetical protein
VVDDVALEGVAVGVDERGGTGRDEGALPDDALVELAEARQRTSL